MKELKRLNTMHNHFNILDLYDHTAECPIVGDFQEVSGYVHVLKEGSANLITDDIQLLSISSNVVLSNRLSMGDYVVGLASYDIDRKKNMVKQVELVNNLCPKTHKKNPGKRFDATIPSRPSNMAKGFGTEFKLGSRIAIKTKKTFDRTDHIIACIEELKSQDIKTIALIIEECESVVPHLTNGGVDHVYITSFNFNPMKQVLVTLLATFQAKNLAEQGNNVVLFVDNLSKLFKVYNKAMGTKFGQESSHLLEIHGSINVSALSDLKGILMSAKQVHGGGSITVTGYLPEPQNKNEEYVNSEIGDIANLMITV